MSSNGRKYREKDRNQRKLRQLPEGAGRRIPQSGSIGCRLAAATKTGIFRKAYPDRHIDCGIAEENMMGVAAGLPFTPITLIPGSMWSLAVR